MVELMENVQSRPNLSGKVSLSLSLGSKFKFGFEFKFEFKFGFSLIPLYIAELIQ
jgi:hypothetical protein